jgi:hypothetical protein
VIDTRRDIARVASERGQARSAESRKVTFSLLSAILDSARRRSRSTSRRRRPSSRRSALGACRRSRPSLVDAESGPGPVGGAGLRQPGATPAVAEAGHRSPRKRRSKPRSRTLRFTTIERDGAGAKGTPGRRTHGRAEGRYTRWPDDATVDFATRAPQAQAGPRTRRK